VASIRVHSFLLPKQGSRVRECEDALAFHRTKRCVAAAVADGATEGFDSRRWARTLARYWTRSTMQTDSPRGFLDGVRALGDRHRERWSRRELPWYIEEKASKGAFASFLGVRLEPSGRWSALATGDCCLFVEESGGSTRSFPATDVEFFTNRPILIPTLHAKYEDMRLHTSRTRGRCATRSTLILMSDAIAAWYFRARHEAEASAGAAIANLRREDRAGLEQQITEERAAGRLRNDDVAILLIDYVGS
jgi:hypothetical protein